ncbi:Uncharacterised protein [Mycoplasmopsis maculosa]|uniref:Uncharacterized protein n=1 Tax=Mycoplasmopsis maculosa TaxID=114885 RepID=A0A449B4M7_9BACT|nr:hypothetical protein [Mycoplasmopsis maculosa]VEU75563.1 Uncharacterised protein [Mycoplasmopsis maculosa]
MEYQEFEQTLRQVLLDNNSKKMIYKLIDAPYRFNSLMHPFEFKVKFEQAFIRSQENKYYNFIKDYALLLFNKYGYKTMENIIKINKVDKNDPQLFIVQNLRFSHVFLDEQNKNLYLVLQKKRDTYSLNESAKLLSKLKEMANDVSDLYKEFNIKAFIWFTEVDHRKNEEFYNTNTFINENEKVTCLARYSSELFAELNHSEDWDQFEIYLSKFKNYNYQDFLKLPDLDTDKEALETLVNLSNSAWDKLNSLEPIYINIRKSIFNERSENSNLFKAKKEREIIQNSSDEDILKNELIKEGLR